LPPLIHVDDVPPLIHVVDALNAPDEPDAEQEYEEYIRGLTEPFPRISDVLISDGEDNIIAAGYPLPVVIHGGNATPCICLKHGECENEMEGTNLRCDRSALFENNPYEYICDDCMSCTSDTLNGDPNPDVLLPGVPFHGIYHTAVAYRRGMRTYGWVCCDRADCRMRVVNYYATFHRLNNRHV